MKINEKETIERLENFELFCIILLFELAENTTSTKVRILKNMIAKAASFEKSIRRKEKETRTKIFTYNAIAKLCLLIYN